MIDPVDARAFDRMISSLDIVGGISFDPLKVLDLRTLTLADLRFGYFLGLLSSDWIVRIETMRGVAGYRQSTTQRSLSYLLPDEYSDVDRLILEGLDVKVLVGSPARQRWLLVVLRMLHERWSRGAGDPQYEAVEFLDAWGTDGDEVWWQIRPTGIDAFVFGMGARNRMLNRLRDYLDERRKSAR
ncbi:hypothetical protein [Microbacterium sp.]|uniref:hypothetical protein n=1 Tax=Microbacterium sp. TaxID=51671 RepID=UPI0039E6D383